VTQSLASLVERQVRAFSASAPSYRPNSKGFPFDEVLTTTGSGGPSIG